MEFFSPQFLAQLVTEDENEDVHYHHCAELALTSVIHCPPSSSLSYPRINVDGDRQ